MTKSISLNSTALPQLVFGNSHAIEDTNVKAMNDRIQSATGFNIAYDIAEPSQSFRHRSSAVNINGLSMVATASTPLHIEVSHAKLPALLIPFSGKSHTLVEKKRHDWNAGEAAILLPATGRNGYDTTRSALFITIDPERINQSARAMLGIEEDKDIDFLALDQARTICLKTTGISLGKQCRLYGQLIDQFAARQDLLEYSGIDEAIYRLIVMLLMPERLTAVSPQLAKDKLNNVCDFIIANLDRKITMTELEDFAGISTRSLQLAFRKRFNCTPMQWIIEQKLHAVRHQLLYPDSKTQVTQIAIHYFSNLGDFSRLYQHRFGELPSQTLARAIN
jgi:AraC-like DNA-binding protein